MADKFIYIHNDDIQNNQNCRLQLLVDRLDTQLNETTTRFLSQRQENVIIRLWGLVQTDKYTSMKL